MESIRYNSEGYYDDTAYKAIRNVMKGERDMQELRKGDIYEYTRIDEKKGTALILSAHKDVCNILNLIEMPHGNAMEVKARDIMYTDTKRIQYVFNNMLESYVRTLKDDEFEVVMEEVRKALGIESSIMSEYGKIEKLEEIIASLRDEKNELESQIANLNETIEDLSYENEYLINKNKNVELTQPIVAEINVTESVEYTKCMAERDLYKELFEKAYIKLAEA